ncbi:MAG: hypothetical protein KME17_05820 [Cyanosarcina radialis HA8281-LM2]|jgi:hypothetical protein|nr:hypothetical protein [Cyanosarcina radialis HA8281-LM2]
MQLKKHATLATAIAIALGSLAALPQSAIAATNINTCTTISTPGSYIVTQNLKANGNCILINTSFVTIDLGGHTLTGNGTGFGISASSTTSFNNAHQGIKIRNGTITNFQIGINFFTSAARSVVVEETIVVANKSIGIAVDRGATVRGNTVSGNGDRGILAKSSLIIENNVSQNGTFGIDAPCPSNVIGNISILNNQSRTGGANLITGTSGCTNALNNAP